MAGIISRGLLDGFHFRFSTMRPISRLWPESRSSYRRGLWCPLLAKDARNGGTLYLEVGRSGPPAYLRLRKHIVRNILFGIIKVKTSAVCFAELPIMSRDRGVSKNAQLRYAWPPWDSNLWRQLVRIGVDDAKLGVPPIALR
jgi:hypothetical protein